MDRNLQQQLAEFENAALGYEDQLFRVALRVVKDRAHAEDLVQETDLQAWRSFDRFEPGTNLRAWLYKIMFNTHHSQRRRLRLQLVQFEETIAETIAYDPLTPQHLTDKRSAGGVGETATRLSDTGGAGGYRGAYFQGTG